MLQEAVRREEVAVHHGCSRPEVLHRAAGGLAGHTGFEEGHRRATGQEERRMETAGLVVLRKGTAVQEEHHMEMERAVRHTETAQGVHRKEMEQGVHHRATEQEAVRRRAIVPEVVVLGGKEERHSGLKAEDQRV